MSRSEFDAAMTQIVGLEVHGLGKKFGTRLFTLFGDECKESRTTACSSPIRVDGRLYTQSGRQWTAGTEEEVDPLTADSATTQRLCACVLHTSWHQLQLSLV